MKRRDLLAGTGGAVLFGLAGCLSAAGLDEHEASPAGVAAEVREETGYEQTNVEEMVIEETIEQVSEDVRVTNYITEHDKAVDLGPVGTVEAASFVVLTSPQISIAGRDFNPISDMSSEELVELIAADFDEIENVEHVSDGETTVLGQETTDSTFDADAQIEGVTADIKIHITESVETANDHLVTIGVYPERLEDIEAENIEALVGGVVEELP